MALVLFEFELVFERTKSSCTLGTPQGSYEGKTLVVFEVQVVVEDCEVLK